MITIRSLAEQIVLITGQELTELNVQLMRLRAIQLRQTILKREFEKTREWFPSTIQAFDVKLTKVKKFGSSAYVSDLLPKSILAKYNIEPFISVGNSLLSTDRRFYDYITPEEIEYIQYRKFSKPDDFYTFENGRIVSFTKERLRVRSVFDDPIEVLNFSMDQDLKLGCTDTTLESPCTEDNDLVIEQTIADAILSSFNVKQDDRTTKETETQN
jgi:hypothetical protein